MTATSHARHQLTGESMAFDVDQSLQTERDVASIRKELQQRNEEAKRRALFAFEDEMDAADH